MNLARILLIGVTCLSLVGCLGGEPTSRPSIPDTLDEDSSEYSGEVFTGDSLDPCAQGEQMVTVTVKGHEITVILPALCDKQDQPVDTGDPADSLELDHIESEFGQPA